MYIYLVQRANCELQKLRNVKLDKTRCGRTSRLHMETVLHLHVMQMYP